MAKRTKDGAEMHEFVVTVILKVKERAEDDSEAVGQAWNRLDFDAVQRQFVVKTTARRR